VVWIADDARDFIYANQGLAEYSDICAFEVDYNATASQLFQEVTRHFILFKGPVAALQNVAAGTSRNLLGLTTWVPDVGFRLSAYLIIDLTE
jgi:hypothetical protein